MTFRGRLLWGQSFVFDNFRGNWLDCGLRFGQGPHRGRLLWGWTIICENFRWNGGDWGLELNWSLKNLRWSQNRGIENGWTRIAWNTQGSAVQWRKILHRVNVNDRLFLSSDQGNKVVWKPGLVVAVWSASPHDANGIKFGFWRNGSKGFVQITKCFVQKSISGRKHRLDRATKNSCRGKHFPSGRKGTFPRSSSTGLVITVSNLEQSLIFRSIQSIVLRVPIQNHFQTGPDPNLRRKFFMPYQSHGQRN